METKVLKEKPVQCHIMKAYEGHGNKDPDIVYLGTRLMSV
jgi:hypothetical protein